MRSIIRFLGLHGDGRENEESIEARLQTAKAGLARLDAIVARQPALAALGLEFHVHLQFVLSMQRSPPRAHKAQHGRLLPLFLPHWNRMKS